MLGLSLNFLLLFLVFCAQGSITTEEKKKERIKILTYLVSTFFKQRLFSHFADTFTLSFRALHGAE